MATSLTLLLGVGGIVAVVLVAVVILITHL